MRAAVRTFRVEGAVDERLKELIRDHCFRPCRNTACDVPHHVAGW